MGVVEGKCGISARVLLDSISPEGVRMLTFEIKYPRLILSELNTHRMLSKNSASSRAIPFKKMQEQLTGRPVRFGQANPGMQDKGGDYDAAVIYNFPDGEPWYASPEDAWNYAKRDATKHSEAFFKAGYHKQVYNRLTEPFQMMKTVVSGTEWANLFWLRDDGAADPTIAELARVMRVAKDASIPSMLYPGEWHLPYVDRYRDSASVLHYGDHVYADGDIVDWIEYNLQDAIKISAARSAAVSFRNVDYDLEKSREVHERLVGDERKHASALEHQATPMKPEHWPEGGGGIVNVPTLSHTWEEGVSHMDRNGQLWSGNIRGWVQYRKLIPGENKTDY